LPAPHHTLETSIKIVVEPHTLQRCDAILKCIVIYTNTHVTELQICVSVIIQSLFFSLFKHILHNVMTDIVSTMENSLCYKIWLKFSIMCLYFPSLKKLVMYKKESIIFFSWLSCGYVEKYIYQQFFWNTCTLKKYKFQYKYYMY
jgi:hypothetical protein